MNKEQTTPLQIQEDLNEGLPTINKVEEHSQDLEKVDDSIEGKNDQVIVLDDNETLENKNVNQTNSLTHKKALNGFMNSAGKALSQHHEKSYKNFQQKLVEVDQQKIKKTVHYNDNVDILQDDALIDSQPNKQVPNEQSLSESIDPQKEESNGVQIAQRKKDVIFYEKDGVTYEAKLTQPISHKQSLQAFMNNAGRSVTFHHVDSFILFKQKFSKKLNPQEENPISPLNQQKSIMTAIKPAKKSLESQNSLENQSQKRKVEVQKLKQSLTNKTYNSQNEISNKDITKRTTVLRPIIESRTIFQKQSKKRELQAKMRSIQGQIDKIDFQDNENKLSSSQPKVRVIVNNNVEEQKVEQKSHEPLIRKFNQIAVMIQISDDPEKKQNAMNLVIKLNQERRDRELKYNHGFHDMEQRIQKQVEQITKERKQMTSQIDNEKKLKIMERITQHEKKKYELAMKQGMTQKFLKELQYQGPKQGEMSRKLMVNLKQNFNSMDNLLDDAEKIEIETQYLPDSGNKLSVKSKSKTRNLGSIFTVRVVREDNKRIRDAKYQQFQKRDLYNKRKEYGKRVNDNFLPKINSNNVFMNQENLLLSRNYRQNLVNYADEDLEVEQPQHQDQQDQANEQPERIKQLSKKRAWQVNNELFNKIDLNAKQE